MRTTSEKHVELVQEFSDGVEGVIAILGFTFEKYDAGGVKTDSIEIPNGGKLRLQTQFRK